MPTTLDYTLTRDEFLRHWRWWLREHRRDQGWTRWIRPVLCLVVPVLLWWSVASAWIVLLATALMVEQLLREWWFPLLFSRFVPDSQFHIDILPGELLVDCKSGESGKKDFRFAIPCDKLAATGSVEESDDYLLLQYPTKNGRLPSRGVLIPKRAFGSDLEMATFRDWLRSCASVGVSLSQATR